MYILIYILPIYCSYIALKVTGGRNGYGAKLTNIFSKKFKIETCDKTKRYTQEREQYLRGMAEKPLLVPAGVDGCIYNRQYIGNIYRQYIILYRERQR